MNNKMTVSSIINDALSIVSKYPMIILIFLIPGIVSMLGGFAIAGGAGAIGTVGEFTVEDGQFDFGSFLPGLLGATALLTIVVSILSILVGAVAIVMTSDAWEQREVDLGRAFDTIKDKIVLLIVASIVLAVLQFIGLLACCVGLIVVVIVTVFVIQGIVLDDLPLTDSFRNSFDLAKKVWPDILILYIIAFLASVILGLIPFIGALIGELVTGFFTVGFTIYYIGLTRMPPVEPMPEE